jgi:hypothetical protein
MKRIFFVYRGKGEWEAVYNAKAKFEGHRQPRKPLWGYPDESDPTVQEKIIDTALNYGVNTFIFDWYWYDNRPFLEAVWSPVMANSVFSSFLIDFYI